MRLDTNPDKCPKCGSTKRNYSLTIGKLVCGNCGEIIRDMVKEEWQELFPEITDEDWESWFGKEDQNV